MKPEQKRVNLHEGIESTLTLLQHQLKHRIELNVAIGAAAQVLCHPNQLNQVFMNILVNAAQSIPGDGCYRDQNVERRRKLCKDRYL